MRKKKDIKEWNNLKRRIVNNGRLCTPIKINREG